jgi:anhydro-N-acetylmuramic acid kinase
VIVAGVMSGTSADGINVAIVEILESRKGDFDGGLRRSHSQTEAAQSRAAAQRSSKRSPQRGNNNSDFSVIDFRLLSHSEYEYPARVRRAVLAAMNAKAATVADLARLNFLLGELYADAVEAARRRSRTKIDLIGCHGQTLYHQGDEESFLGKKLKVTWQTGEAAVIAARMRAPAISDFRPADMAAGGKGAPLVPFLDYMLYRDAHIGRVAQNIGGIANLTAIPAHASAKQVMAFDTGPGNMVIDAVMERLYARTYDKDGAKAASGKVLVPVVERVLQGRFFGNAPPKTAGREEFGREFVADFLRKCGRARKEDVVATATALTAASIGDALRRFVLKRSSDYKELIASGGGTQNPTLMRMLATEVGRLGLRLRRSDEFGVPAEAKEAVAFALLAYETWNGRPSNIPSATGARRPAILGKISYV